MGRRRNPSAIKARKTENGDGSGPAGRENAHLRSVGSRQNHRGKRQPLWVKRDPGAEIVWPAHSLRKSFLTPDADSLGYAITEVHAHDHLLERATLSIGAVSPGQHFEQEPPSSRSPTSELPTRQARLGLLLRVRLSRRGVTARSPGMRTPMTELNFFKSTNGCIDSRAPLVKIREFFEKGHSTHARSHRYLTNGHR
ncbi:MAG TPA: hypothetical protein VHZ07_28495 [Bryobacteraceae bacterium]|nr:hypothetical protein [Bryobacteraceae bacterium]